MAKEDGQEVGGIDVRDGWRSTTIGELCDQGSGSVQTGPFGSQLHASEYVDDGIPVVMPANLGNNRIIENGIARVSAETRARLAKHILHEGDIVYGRRGDIGRRALVRSYQEGWLCGTGCLRIRFGAAPVDSRFVSYYLGQKHVKELILAKAVGSTMPNLNTKILRSVPLALPPLLTQRRIAEILGALDDKVECNRRINQTLEQMAQALYKHWFVDFAPFRDDEFVDSELEPIPKGWQVGTVTDLCELAYGKGGSLVFLVVDHNIEWSPTPSPIRGLPVRDARRQATDDSPALQRWGPSSPFHLSPEGTAETHGPSPTATLSFQSSRQDWAPWWVRLPAVKLLPLCPSCPAGTGIQHVGMDHGNSQRDEKVCLKERRISGPYPEEWPLTA